MMRLLVTGADGFVGQHLVRAARGAGNSVIATILPDAAPPSEWLERQAGPAVDVVRADLSVAADVKRTGELRPDAVVHLAAIASGAAARQDPAGAMQFNSTAAVTLIKALGSSARPPRILFVSTGEVYGPGHKGPISEVSPMDPVSPYATSKAAAEDALENLGRVNGLPVIVARAFPHTGPGQSTAYVLPALAARLLEARRTGQREVPVGNLDAVRDFLDVRDVVRAYLFLLEMGEAGSRYNVASGVGRRLRDCFTLLAEMVGIDAEPRQDASLLRPADIPVLIGDPAKLRHATAWSPQISFERTLQDLVNAQAH